MDMRKQLGWVLLMMLSPVSLAQAEVQTKEVTYTHEGVTFKGFLAWDDAIQGKRPGVLVVHEWWGLNDYARDRAKQLAKLGYVAFACDMYGEGKATKHPNEAGQMAGAVRQNLKTWQGRAMASLKVLQENEMVDPTKLAAIGYCFGGSTSLQLAYSGADVKAVVSFHGAVVVPTEEQAKAIKAKILYCHGALDNFIPDEQIVKMRKAWDAAGADYQIVYYGGAVHSFTVPHAEQAGVPGIKYNAEADRRSWHEMQMLFQEVFGDKK
jgi:dienelactone hydrolase